jgi:predicted ATPase
MISINYDPIHGEAIRDGSVDSLVNQWIKRDFVTIDVSTSNIVDALRLAVKEGRLPKEHIVFFFREKTKIRIDDNGNLDHWPEGFCDTLDKITERLIDWNE